MGVKGLGKRRLGSDEFAEVFAALCRILRKHDKGLVRSIDSDRALIYAGPMMPRWNRELWFGGAKIGRAYVSYHLMPVYMYPDLLESVSAELKARMQGKSCFNFSRCDSKLFAELDKLTSASVERLIEENIL